MAILRNGVVVGLLFLGSGYADTVTATDHLSVNGVLTRLSEGTITLEARYTSGPQTLMIPLSRVETIEFNSIAFNPGAPPKAYGLGPGGSTKQLPAPPKRPVVADAIELRGGGGDQKPCKVVSIDENVVHCETASEGKKKGLPSEYSRRIVLRILVAGGR
jgi:hypothetical protein